MTEVPAQETTPAPALPRNVQLRYLGIAAAAIVALWLLFKVAAWLLTPAEVPTKPLPPGVLQLAPEALAGMRFEAAVPADGWSTTNANGMITADETRSTPIFLPFSGQVTEVFVDAGASVTRGQPLFRIRSSDIADVRNALLTAEAQRQSATAALKLAQGNLERQRAMFQSAGGAQKDYFQAQSDYAAAQAALRSADSAAAAARDKLALMGKSGAGIDQLGRSGSQSETILHAPISGVIAARAVSAGQFVQAGGDKPVFVIANPSQVWLVAQIAESDAQNVHLGDPVDVTVTALPGRVFHARIDNVAAGLDPVTHRLAVRATLANPDGALKPQMFGSFTIRHAMPTAPGGNKGVTVPAVAVIHEGDTARIWVQVGPNLVRARMVKVGDSANGRITILDGLRPGERVVTAGAIFVNEAGLGE